MLKLEAHVSHLKEDMRIFKKEIRDALQQSYARQSRLEQEIIKLHRQSNDRIATYSREQDELRRLSEENAQRHEEAMREAEIQARQERGERSRKMGTLAEDYVAPAMARIFQQLVGCSENDLDFQAEQVRRAYPDYHRFDVVAGCADYVLINETRNTLCPQDLKDFRALMETARDYFPEYAEKKFIGAMASLYVDESLVRQGEKLGLIVLGFGEDLMDVLNLPGFRPMEF